MEDILVPIGVCATIFIGLPWILFHYITQWKKTGTLSLEDERLLDELHDLARRLEERVRTVERIIAADDASFRAGLGRPAQDQEIGRSIERTPETRAGR